MKALKISDLQGPESVSLTDAEPPNTVSQPIAHMGEPILVSVRAAGVSFPDVLQARGLYQFKPELPFIPGGEISGVVEDAPAESGLRVGDRVAAFSFTGGLAEQVLVPSQVTFKLHDSLSFTEGAALVINYHTAYFALVTRGRLAPGARVLVQGAAGGVGTATIQVAKGLGAEVVAVVSNDTKAAIAQQAGADHVFRTTDNWREQTLGVMPDGVDIVIDPVGGDRIIDNLRVLREFGRFVVVGFADGEIPQIPANRLLLKNIDAVGAVWGSYVMAHPEYASEVAKKLDALISSGHVRPIVGASFHISEGSEAFRHVEDRKSLGKVVVEVQ
ncbi:MAG: NADPH:quinone oxidoreductase family protein [Leucobacter sp.]|nr:NADPH:quinone oxidoreductase family protein [Leucobacter sp.]